MQNSRPSENKKRQAVETCLLYFLKPDLEPVVHAQRAAVAIRGHVQAEAAADRPLVVELVSTVEVLVKLEIVDIRQSQAPADIRRLGAEALAGQRKDRQRKNQYNLLHNSTN